jgi:uncharacterized protein YegP (UPF0339 family)
MRAARIEVFRRKRYGFPTGKWGWRLIAANGRRIATDGGQGFENKGDAIDIVEKIKNGYFAQAVVTVEGEDF